MLRTIPALLGLQPPELQGACILTENPLEASAPKALALGLPDAVMILYHLLHDAREELLDQIRVQARAIIEHRISQEENALAMLVEGFWWPEFVFNSGSMSKPDDYAGYWLKFNDDFTYNYGLYDRTFGKGLSS